ncbi:tetratricopeptide repeat protein 25 [Nephila pilipes]|uniref:Outer dynein arm-docking complex subunit 4 n=1 Tax=Nephila pilipes TaxID=299642 RepID=A0A8X6MDW2_NEPPI|nr:tetratricopeptide repeat protein 25 [Nephila pilipes]
MVAYEDFENETVTKKASKFPITLHISEGNKLIRLFQYKKAMDRFNAGLKTQPNNIRCLLGRAKCLIGLGEYDEARQHAEKIMKLDSKCSEAFSLHGNAEYSKGNFEEGLKSFCTAFQNQPYSIALKLGQQMCKKATDNSINTDVLLDQTDISEVNKLLKDKTMKLDYRFQGHFRKIPFTKDLKLIKSVLKDKDLSSVSAKCQDLYQYLKERREFWRTQNPDLTRRPLKRERKKYSSQLLRDLAFQQCADSEKYLLEGDISKCKKLCHETLKFIKTVFEESSPDSLETRANIFHILGLACMFTNDISSALKYHKQELKSAEKCGVIELKKKALLDLGEDYLKGGNFKQASAMFHQSLDFVESDDEKAIILYKIADCEMYLDNLEKSANIGRKSLTIAVSRKDSRLQCDATMLLAEISVKANDMEAAKNLYKDALQIAEKNKDSRVNKIKDLIMFYEALIERTRLEVEKNITKKTVNKTRASKCMENVKVTEPYGLSDSTKLIYSDPELLHRTISSDIHRDTSEEKYRNSLTENKRDRVNLPVTQLHDMNYSESQLHSRIIHSNVDDNTIKEKNHQNILSEKCNVTYSEPNLHSGVTPSDIDSEEFNASDDENIVNKEETHNKHESGS